MVLWFYNGPLVSKEHSSAPLISKEHCSAPLISKEHYSAPLADNSAPLLKGALLKWANSALQKSNDPNSYHINSSKEFQKTPVVLIFKVKLLRWTKETPYT